MHANTHTYTSCQRPHLAASREKKKKTGVERDDMGEDFRKQLLSVFCWKRVRLESCQGAATEWLHPSDTDCVWSSYLLPPERTAGHTVGIKHESRTKESTGGREAEDPSTPLLHTFIPSSLSLHHSERRREASALTLQSSARWAAALPPVRTRELRETRAAEAFRLHPQTRPWGLRNHPPPHFETTQRLEIESGMRRRIDGCDAGFGVLLEDGTGEDTGGQERRTGEERSQERTEEDRRGEESGEERRGQERSQERRGVRRGQKRTGEERSQERRGQDRSQDRIVEESTLEDRG
ncbi:unnamed protein product [Pleuronectes platessa]|uniref:Uncharacterized protein n=1 Tax=Pleuronectes platessa TaxID=8262 RepID=A0A9N7TS68_PLEPL|nr:unnamed protein product [Pleuronectes platessa]